MCADVCTRWGVGLTVCVSALERTLDCFATNRHTHTHTRVGDYMRVLVCVRICYLLLGNKRCAPTS